MKELTNQRRNNKKREIMDRRKEEIRTKTARQI
jgi:hypothetical protein